MPPRQRRQKLIRGIVYMRINDKKIPEEIFPGRRFPKAISRPIDHNFNQLNQLIGLWYEIASAEGFIRDRGYPRHHMVKIASIVFVQFPAAGLTAEFFCIDSD
ncbi:hypothetical protein Tco_0435484 [Tanacetum coccineum]